MSQFGVGGLKLSVWMYKVNSVKDVLPPTIWVGAPGWPPPAHIVEGGVRHCPKGGD